MNSPVSRHTLAVIAFLGIVVVAQMLPGQSPTTTPEASDSDSSQQAGGDMEFVRRDDDDPKAIGDVDAPVVMTEWIDLRCPFCASFARESLPQLIEEYIEYTDVAYFGEQSEDASVAAQAAANQDKYIDYITAIFDDAPENGHADLTRDILIDYAEQVDVPDMDAFTEDLDDPAIREQAQAETMNAQRLGVSAVPFFVAGDTAMSGAQPVDSFRDYLDDAVAKAE